MVVDPTGEDRRFHCRCPGLWKVAHPCIQFVARCSYRALPLHLAARILNAIADRLVNVQPDVIHMSVEEPP